VIPGHRSWAGGNLRQNPPNKAVHKGCVKQAERKHDGHVETSAATGIDRTAGLLWSDVMLLSDQLKRRGHAAVPGAVIVRHRSPLSRAGSAVPVGIADGKILGSFRILAQVPRGSVVGQIERSCCVAGPLAYGMRG